MKLFQLDNLSGKNHEGAHPNTPVKVLTTTSIIGDKVINSHGEHLGMIKDIMIDLAEGKIEYVVIEFGGFLGLGEKLFAIPFPLLKVDPKKQVFVMNQDKETLKKAPGFNKDHWPETNSHLSDSSSYWGSFMGSNTGAVPY